MGKFAPRACLTSPIWNWATDIAPISPQVPEDVRKLVEEKKKAIIERKLVVFNCPVKDQYGNVRIPAGKSSDMEHLLNMKYFVDGVVGKAVKIFAASDGTSGMPIGSGPAQ